MAQASKKQKTRWFAPVATLARHLFVSQVQLERRKGKLHVVLQDSKGAETPSSGTTKPAPATAGPPTAMGVDAAQLARMQETLADVLNQHQGSRAVLKHLGYLERALRRQGARCLLDLPLEVLKPALLQLESVSGPQPGKGLAELRACLIVTVVDRDGDTGDDDAQDERHSDHGNRLSDFSVGDKIQVCEVSHSDFLKADEQWPLVEEAAPH
jgi:hypothetical protein